MAAVGFFERYVSAMPIFTRRDFRAKFALENPDMSKEDQIKAADDILEYQTRVQRIGNYATGVYATIAARYLEEMNKDPTKNPKPDWYSVASLIRDDGVIAYHSAIELHGYPYSDTSEIKVLSEGRPGLMQTEVGNIRFVKFPAEELRSNDDRGIKVLKRDGLDIRVTTLERSILDCLERPELAVDIEELEHTLSAVEPAMLKLKPLISMVERRGNRTLAGLVGWWLEKWRDGMDPGNNDDLRVMDKIDQLLPRLQELSPVSPRTYAGALRGEGTHVKKWGLWLPDKLAEAEFEAGENKRGMQP